MRFYAVLSVALLVLLGQRTTTGQEEGVLPEALATGVQLNSLRALQSIGAQRESDYALQLLPMLMANDNMLASEDGHYLAQNNQELQTYYDLDLTYRYIEEPYFRRQLKLPEEQGIVIVTASPAGLGYLGGLRDGDIVLQVDEAPVDTQYDLVIALSEERGTQRTLLCRRDGEPQQLDLTLPAIDDEPTKRYILGVSAEPASEAVQAQIQRAGLVVTSVTEDGPAAAAGILVHDVIAEVDDHVVRDIDELRGVMQDSGGNPVNLRLVRAGKILQVVVTPSSVTEELATVNQSFLDLYVTPRVTFDRRALDLTFQPTRNLAWSELVDMSLNTGVDTEGVEVSPLEKIDQLLEQVRQIQEQLESIKSSLDR